MSDVFCEKQFKIAEPGCPALTVCPWPEVEGFVTIMAVGKAAEDFFGRIEVSMSSAFARALAKALFEIADHVEGK